MTNDTPASARMIPPSAEVRAEALRRAHALAEGLFSHQIDGLAFLLGRRRAVLADDMGLGKTRQSIVALTEAAPNGPYLVVVPASVKRNWEREILMACPTARVAIVGPNAPPKPGFDGWVIVNYDILAKHKDSLEALPFIGLVFDEAHYLKNHTSQRSKLARALVASAPDAVLHALTGTPLTNRPRDLFPLLQLVGHPMGRSFLSFAKRYCDAHHNGYGWVTDGASNLEELRVQLHGVMLRRTKDEVLDLPPKLRTWLSVPVPEGTGRKEMRRVLEALLTGGLKQDRVRLLARLMRARQQIARAKVGTTIEFIEGVVSQGEKVIVFSSFEEPLDRLSGHFGDAAVTLTGRTPAAHRLELVDRFQNDPSVRVFVANLMVGGVGINLTAARQVVFNDLDWVPANHWQAEDRAYRIGQTSTVNVTYFVAEGTVDEFVRHALGVKASLIEAVVEGTGAVPIDADLLAELESLLRGLSPSIATLGDAESGEDAVDRLLREAAQAMAAKEASTEQRAARVALRQLPAEAILALARVLSGPTAQRYRVASSSKPGVFHVLDVVGGDVTCTCPGFEYRGACNHARELKAALATGRSLPNGYETVLTVGPTEKSPG
jgi:SWI/SNF-related matrix-associated actin-dependent regulator of chromatin subfamily A-like protein 1